MSDSNWAEYWDEWVWESEFELKQLARKVLGISSEAGLREIKDAYRSLALRFHPDRDLSDSSLEDRFKVIAEAYEILTSDRNKHSRRAISLCSWEDIPEEPPSYAHWWLDQFGHMF